MMISKSSYVQYKSCGKSLWLKFYKPKVINQEIKMSNNLKENGYIVGELAKTYFSNTVDCSVKKGDGTIDYAKQIEKTKEAIASKANAIAEASFLVGDLFCAVDILKLDGDGYKIYEVKSVLNLEDKHYYDVAFQKYVLKLEGLNIKESNLLHPNKGYVFDGTLDVNKYFLCECVDCNETVVETLKNIDDDINKIRDILSRKRELKNPFINSCGKCCFSEYCFRKIPKHSIGSLNGFGTKAYKFYNKGIFTINDFVKTAEYLDYKNKQDAAFKKNGKMNFISKNYIDCLLNGVKSPVVDKAKVKAFLDKLKFPIYYLDFETSNKAIPSVVGKAPFSEFAYQYSLHIEYADGTVVHKEFLAESYDCSNEIAKSLVNNISDEGTLVAHNSSTEESIIKLLAKENPMYHDRLINMVNRFVDTMDPFKEGAYYDLKQLGSASIKDIMPALCPKMKDYYKKLPVVHNGTEALEIFNKVVELAGTTDGDRLKKGLLEYCKLDTLSMVEIVKVLREAIK